MLLQMLQDSFAVLRKPTIESFKAHGKNNTAWPIIYFGIGAAISVILQLIRIPLQHAYFEQQQAQLSSASPFLANLSNSVESPVIILLLGALGFIINLMIWIVAPYYLGRMLGGNGSLGQVAYNNALVNVPISILDGLISFGLLTPLSCLFLILSLSLDVVRLCLTSVGTQAAMNLEGAGNFWKLLILIFLAVIVSIGINTTVAAGLAALSLNT